MQQELTSKYQKLMELYSMSLGTYPYDVNWGVHPDRRLCDDTASP